mmetsp:Transcript_40797/g.46774  ORF Transcript_40797/g.46774 Transcript_40797/m.46774 type:complete len:293 (+) Transcript_40797:2313-3191(+)
MDSHEFTVLRYSVSSSIKHLMQILTTSSLVGRANMEMELMALSNLLIRPEFVEYSHVASLAQVIQTVSNLDDTTLLVLPTTFRHAYLDIVSRYVARVQYEYNVSLKTHNTTELYSSLSTTTIDSKLASLLSSSKIVWLAAEKYLARISSTLTVASPLFSYQTVVGLFKVEHKMASTINGTTYSFDSGKNYNLVLPSDVFAGSIVTDMQSAVRVVSVCWYVSPMPLSELDVYEVGSSTFSVHLLNTARSQVAVKNKSVYVTAPYFKSYSYASSPETCKSWDANFSTNDLTETA